MEGGANQVQTYLGQSLHLYETGCLSMNVKFESYVQCRKNYLVLTNASEMGGQGIEGLSVNTYSVVYYVSSKLEK